MARGIIYVMTTVVPGLVKIGKTGSQNFESRMYSLERNGYYNVVGLRRHFAIEVDDYDEKEELLDEIFSKSRVPGSELFALDASLVVQLLSSFDGAQIFPKDESKEDAFDQATEQRDADSNWSCIPDGTYHIDSHVKGMSGSSATMVAKGGSFVVKAGSICLTDPSDKWRPEARKTAAIENGVLQHDVVCRAPSTAGWVVLDRRNNGWKIWKTGDGHLLDSFRKLGE